MSDNGSLFLGLRTTIYKVGDIVKAKEWYSKAFLTQPYFDEAFYVGFNIMGYEMGLLPEENGDQHKPDSVLSYWGVDDIQRVYSHLIEMGATEHEKPTNGRGRIDGGLGKGSLAEYNRNYL